MLITRPSSSSHTLNRDIESTVETDKSVRFEHFDQTVAQTSELSVGSRFTDICAQSGSGEVQGIDKAQGCGTGCSTGRQVSNKVSPELGFFVDPSQEDLFVFVFEREVQRLSREISDHIREVSSPVGDDSLFFRNAYKRVDNTCPSK